MKKKRLCIMFFIFIVLLAFCTMYFKPMNLVECITRNYDINIINTINITEVFTALNSKNYVVTDSEGINAITQFLCGVSVHRNIYTPSVFSIQPYKSYTIYCIGKNRELLYITINPDLSSGLFITIITSAGKENYRIIEPLNFEKLSDIVNNYAE